MDGFWFYDVVFNGFMFALLCPEYFERRLGRTRKLRHLSRPSGLTSNPPKQNKGWVRCIHMHIKPLTGSMDPLTINGLISS